MELINPFSKAMTVPAQSSTRLRALVPTGANVGHGNDLSITRRHGRKHQGLEHYRGKSSGGTQGPFGKSVARGLAMTGGYKPTSVPKALTTPKRVRLARAQQGAPTPMSFTSASSSGRKIR